MTNNLNKKLEETFQKIMTPANSTSTKTVERVMLDLETVSTSAGCGILSIGACTFDCKHKFYERIDPASSRIYLKEDMETLRWWNKQDPQLKQEAFGGSKELLTVLIAFGNWFRSLNGGCYKDIEIWGNGADFDLPILSAAYLRMDLKQPWGAYNGRCYRTLKNLLPHVKAPARASAKHHALDDAIYQAEHASLILQVL